jgi:manganese/iron transport system permease protein
MSLAKRGFFMLQLLLEPLQYQFMQRAIEIGLLIGILCPVVGTYLIVQRMALLGDVIAHCVLPGLSISYFLQIDVLIGAFTSGILGAFFINGIRAQTRIKVDAAMALTFSTFFALGVTLINVLKNRRLLDEFLFGDILSITGSDLLRTGVITGGILLTVILFYKELLFYMFDRTAAQAAGLPVNLMQNGFMVAVTLTIIASMQAVGVILVIALLVGPALTAYLLVKELSQVMFLGAGIGIFSVIAGIYVSYYQDLPSGPAIVLVTATLFVAVLLFEPSAGLIVQQYRLRFRSEQNR